MNPDQYLLTSPKVAKLLNVHESSIKRWCNSGELPTQTTEGGHRRISWTAFQEFSDTRELSHPYTPFKKEALMVYLGHQQLLKKNQPLSLQETIQTWMSRNELCYIAPLLLLVLNETKWNYSYIFDNILFPSLKQVGQWWLNGKITTSDEHRISQEWQQGLIISRFHIHKNIEFSHKPLKAIVACSEENTHEIACHCLRLILEYRGIEVIFLGARVPTSDLIKAQLHYRTELVCVSYSPYNKMNDIELAHETLSNSYDPFRPYALAFGGVPLKGWNPPKNKSPFLHEGTFSDMIFFEKWLDEWHSS